MTTMEHLPALQETHEELDSESIATAVVERALLFSELGGDMLKHMLFREKMGIRYMEFGDYFDGASRVIVADDTVQESGAFKSRGAASATLATSARTLVAASAGNHGNGLAIAGKKAGKAVVIEAAANTSPVKIQNMTRNEATVNAVHPSVDAAMPAAIAKGEEEDVAFVHPYDNLDVIAGQATMALEMLDQLLSEEDKHTLDLHKDQVEILVPIGGGGLITGVASVFYWAKSVGLVGENVIVRGVQMEGCDAMRREVSGMTQPLFEDGEFNPACDGTAVTKVGELAKTVVSDTRFVHDVLTVSQAELGVSMRHLDSLLGKQIEPAGALSMAGAQKLMQQRSYGDCTYLTVSTGRNVSAETWQQFMEASKSKRTTTTNALGGYVMRGATGMSSTTELTVDPHVTELYYDSLESLGLFLRRR